MKCQFCAQPWEDSKFHPGFCSSCGAPKPEREPLKKYDPFFYGGMIVYALRDPAMCAHEYVFYRGDLFVGRVFLHDYEVEKMEPGLDIMPMLIDRLSQNAPHP
jgi:hypothetical protein